MDILDPCSDGDLNNNVSSLYVEIIEKNRSYYILVHDLWPKVVEETKTRNLLELCSWQRWEITLANHNFECDYKSFTLISKQKDTTLGSMRYTDDHSVSVPRSTTLYRNKRSATRSKTAGSRLFRYKSLQVVSLQHGVDSLHTQSRFATHLRSFRFKLQKPKSRFAT